MGFPSHQPTSREQRLLRAGDLELDETRWTVHRAGTEVGLSPTEFRLLAYLMRNQGQVLSRAQLLERVWGRDRTARPQVVETYVSYLRRKLDAHGPRVIHTRRGVGYLLRPASGHCRVLPSAMSPPPVFGPTSPARGDESGELP